MKKNVIKLIFMIIICGLSIWIFSNSSNAAYVSIKPSTTSANPGQTVSLTISSDCIGKVNLSASNGKLSSNSVFIDGNQTVSIVVGNSGTVAVTATPVDMSDLTGNPVSIGPSSASISINSSSSSTSTANNGNAGATNQETNKKSSNANLSNLGIRPNDFTGFKAATTTYNVTVPSNVQEIEVYATAQDSKAKISGIGKKQLQEGQNTISVVVTAEDGTKKTYTINVTKSGETEEPEKEEEVSKGLSELKIGDLELTPEFKTDVYEYAIKYVGTETSLDINAIATDKDYIVDIMGNENLQEGENIITILVSDAEENNVATYQIKVDKSLTEEVEIQAENQNVKEGQKQNKIIIIGVIILVGIIVIIIYIIIRRKRNENWEEDYSMPYSDEEEYDNEDYDYEEYENQNNSIEEHQSDNLEEEYDEQNNNVEEDYDNQDDNNEEYNNQKNKEALKEEYLNNYNNNNEYEDWKEDAPKRKRHKGKRFK